MDLKLSCPAVSHIIVLTVLPSTWKIFDPNSTPRVDS